MSIIGKADVGQPIPYIPSRAERRARAKKAGVFKHPGGWKHVNEAAYMQRNNAIQKAMDLQNKREHAPKQKGE